MQQVALITILCVPQSQDYVTVVLAYHAAAEARSSKLMAQLVDERGRLVDAVIEQANSSTPQMAAELAKSLEVVHGKDCTSNISSTHGAIYAAAPASIEHCFIEFVKMGWYTCWVYCCF